MVNLLVIERRGRIGFLGSEQSLDIIKVQPWSLSTHNIHLFVQYSKLKSYLKVQTMVYVVKGIYFV